MWIAIGEKTRIRKLFREDVDQMQNWGSHRDPLFFHYNFPYLDTNERDEWYRSKTGKFRKKSFAIENTRGEVIGFLSIRDIQWIKRESELGIVLNPDCMNEGYGTDAIKAFLYYYFQGMKMKTITLRVAHFNERAIRCYCKCGFEVIGEEEMAFEDQRAEIFYNPKYHDLQKLFTRTKQGMATKYMRMALKKENYEHRINSLSTKTVWKCE
ncbi:GNAT family N-acetyltransferase [Thermotalea metallivorans]|uniref:Spermidine N(1)-acetyltransferase n=1 Tax=Thermotalea metallivorans TaxID=520762 RepID=A0A140L028_9FIRM|nr:GNAT family N-acetyltransferase [Thermotalea metallivorans]KXG73903.1 Spermidine N(1)-acetyltransferase [Thermotalea metallivorans]